MLLIFPKHLLFSVILSQRKQICSVDMLTGGHSDISLDLADANLMLLSLRSDRSRRVAVACGTDGKTLACWFLQHCRDCWLQESGYHMTLFLLQFWAQFGRMRLSGWVNICDTNTNAVRQTTNHNNYHNPSCHCQR